ncbi:MAG TPA: phage holin family protein [Bacteroidales bacterium]|nr:phage holin family protein [Bacteroidales bacterium]
MNKQTFDAHLRKITRSIKQYLQLKTELYSLIVVERLARIYSHFIAALIFTFFIFFFTLFLSLGFVSWFTAMTGRTFLGYLIVAAFYLLMALIVHVFRRRIFFDPMVKTLTKTIFEKEDELGKEQIMEDPYEED